MKVYIALLLVSVSLANGETVNPTEKVVQLLGDLTGKIIAEGEAAQKLYAEFAENTKDQARQLQFDIKTGKANVEELKACIEQQTANAEASSTKIEEVGAAIAKAQTQLAAATKNRADERAIFVKEEKELVDVIDTLGRAISILEREMAKGSSSLVQLKNAKTLSEALSVIVDAGSINSADASRLTALVQTSDSDEDMGAPAAAVYSNQSGGIVETLEGLLDKAKGQLDELRKKETNALHAFEMMKQSLEDEVKFANKDMAAAKEALSAAEGSKAKCAGDLAVTQKALSEDVTALDDLHRQAMAKATSFEAEVKSRDEELKALATAKKVILESTGGANGLTYSFMQVASSAPLEAVRIVRELGRSQHDAALTQLSMKMSALTNGQLNGPFDKVVGLIKDMLAKLEEEASKDATEKAYCDDELAETREKKADKEADIAKLSTAIDSNSAKSATLKEEVSDLTASLATLAKDTAEAMKVRAAEKSLFKTSKAELEAGLEGVKKALQVLRDYYGKADKAHSSADGAGSNIIGLLEVVESDFSKGLAEMVADEEASAERFDAFSKEAEIEKTTKDQDVKYKKQEIASLGKTVNDDSGDRAGIQEELDAINAYLEKLTERCVAKPETYEERKRRREAELAGLKEALSILSSGSAFIQKNARRSLRGVMMP